MRRFFRMRRTRAKRFFSTLLLLCCLYPATGLAGASPSLPSGLPSYTLPPPKTQYDSYILTQLFLAAFDAGDIESVQVALRQGMLSAPRDFPRVMALTLELIRNPDERLFMLLYPLAEYVSSPERAVDISPMIRLTDMLTGYAPPAEPRPEAGSPSGPGEIPPGSGTTEPGKLFFKESPPHSLALVWERELKAGRTTHTAVSEALDNGSLRGRVSTRGPDGRRDYFFILSNGIISLEAPPPDHLREE
ncbi:MAG: hypothetical protein LBQ63_00450 [Deltaproteobacteria bacterium]|jgi:hypothetical protein|nr:hypothetical protein [Deltaproteobacteria bacterium]